MIASRPTLLNEVDRLLRLFGIEAATEHARAGIGKGKRRRAPLAARGAGNEGNLPRKGPMVLVHDDLRW